MCSIPGISRTTAEVLIAEIEGAQHVPFPHRRAPVRVGGGGPGQPRVRWQTPPRGHPSRGTVAAPDSRAGGPGSRSDKGSYFSAHYARIARRRGHNKAVVAVANSMVAVAWHLLRNGALYEDPGADYFERRNDPAKEAKRLQRRIEALGFDVTIVNKAT